MQRDRIITTALAGGEAPMKPMKGRVVVIGATGQIGRPLCHELALAGRAVSVFSRDPARAAQLVPGAADYLEWGPGNRLTAQCAGHLAAADAVVYLAGAPLFDGHRHSRAGIEAEGRARVAALGHLVAALNGLDRRPATLIAASSVGYYGFQGRGDEPVDEASPTGPDWWGADSAAIERAALLARQHGIRTVVLRTGYVLTAASLASQVAQFRRHLGGWIGTGRGWTPWIHIADEVGAIVFALERPDISGPVNLTSPEPVRARQFARILGQVLGRRSWLPVPAPFVRMGLGAVTDILVRGKRVVPSKMSAAGYEFRFPVLDRALRDILEGERAT
jgi:uncharacterized protein (TIGR01777 family)